MLLRISGQGHRNDDREHNREIGSARFIFNHIPKIQNQRRLTVRFDDTSDDDSDFGEFENPSGR